MGFQFDHTIDGRQVKLLNVIDEYTREALAIRVDRSIGADDVVNTLTRLAVERGGPPAFVRFDNGPEFVAHAVADWCAESGAGAVFIDPGSPWQNAWIESFNGKLRDERTPSPNDGSDPSDESSTIGPSSGTAASSNESSPITSTTTTSTGRTDPSNSDHQHPPTSRREAPPATVTALRTTRCDGEYRNAA
jgi:transposase InsO family protein